LKIYDVCNNEQTWFKSDVVTRETVTSVVTTCTVSIRDYAPETRISYTVGGRFCGMPICLCVTLKHRQTCDLVRH